MWGGWKFGAQFACEGGGAGSDGQGSGRKFAEKAAIQKCPEHLQFTPTTPVFLSLTLFVAMAACCPLFEPREDGPWFVC